MEWKINLVNNEEKSRSRYISVTVKERESEKKEWVGEKENKYIIY
jgi:hypothetical protein